MAGKRVPALTVRLIVAGCSAELYRVACERAHLRAMQAGAR